VPDPDDRRASRARLTSTGIGVRPSIMDFRREHIRALTKPMQLSAATRSELARIADALDAFR
jgi:hypothetical protein